MKKLNKFEKTLDIKMMDKNLLTKAFTHKSLNPTNNNEKLEFLGDRVIGLVLSKKLIDLYPNENEGILDKKFAKLVNKSTCSTIGWSIQLQDYIILGDSKKKITPKDEKILSDACEALIGAVYADQGFDVAQKFVLRLWKKYIDKSNMTILDPKTRLQEYSLKKFKKLPIYKLITSRGPRHNPTFKIAVSIQNSKLHTGMGSSKQNAQQNAAKKLLKSMNIN